MASRKQPLPSWRIALSRAAPAVITWFGLCEGILLLFFRRDLVLTVWMFHYVLLIPSLFGFVWMRRVIGGSILKFRGVFIALLIFIPVGLSYVVLQQAPGGVPHGRPLAVLVFYLLPFFWGVITWLFIQELAPVLNLRTPVIHDYLVIGPVAGLLWMAQWDRDIFLRWLAFAGLVYLAVRRWYDARDLYRTKEPDLHGAAKGGYLLLRPLWRSLSIVMFWLAGMAGLSLIRFHTAVVTMIWFFHFITSVLMLMLVDYGHQSSKGLFNHSITGAKTE